MTSTDYNFEFDRKRPIKVGELQVNDISSDFKLLYVRDLNPVLLALNWCEKNNHQWLSFPEAVRDFGFSNLRQIAPSHSDVYFLRRGWGKSDERIFPQMMFNSYILTMLKDLSAPIEERIQVYLGHNVLFSQDYMRQNYNSELGLPVNINKDNSFLLGQYAADVSRYFDPAALDGIGWLNHAFSASSENLERILFENNLDDVRNEFSKTRSYPSLSAMLPRDVPQLNMIKMSSDLHFDAFTFYNGSEEFADYFLVKKKD